MPQCLTANSTLTVHQATHESADTNGVSFYVKVDTANPEVTVTFSDCTSVTTSPSLSSASRDPKALIFSTSDTGTFQLTFTPAPPPPADAAAGPIETPNTNPIFKPQGSCPP